MQPGINLNSLSNRDLSALEQQILIEQAQRVINSSTAIVIEPDASEEIHRKAIALLLEKKQN
jgi:hypothetical protein